MKKFLTVLLALSVVFTYSFSAVGTVFAAEYTLDDYSAALTGEKAAQLTYLEKAKDQVIGAYNFDADGFEKVGGTYMKAAYEAAAKKVIADTTTAMNAAINTVLNGKDWPKADAPDKTVVSDVTTKATVGTDTNVDLTTAAGMKKAIEAETDALNKAQVPLTKAFAESKLTVDLTKYNSVDKAYDADFNEGTLLTAAQAVQKAIADAKAAIKEADAETTDATKLAGYKNAAKNFGDALGKIKTLDDEKFESDINAGSVDAAIEAYAKATLDVIAASLAIDPNMSASATKDWSALVATGGALAAFWDADGKELFGVKIADIAKVTRTEVAAVSAAYKAAVAAAKAPIKTYAAGDATKVTALDAADKQLSALANATKVVDKYAEVVTYGDKLKAEYNYGVKIYDDAKVTDAVKAAEALVYADLMEASLKTAKAYLEAAADGNLENLKLDNYEADRFVKAIEDAAKKMYSTGTSDTFTPAVVVLYGDNKTPEADLVYLKGTYDATEAYPEWDKIAQAAVADLKDAQSYNEITSIMDNAAKEFSKLLKDADADQVKAARLSYTTALVNYAKLKNDLADATKYTPGDSSTNNLLKEFFAACEQGKALIEKANTVKDVEAAYAEGQKIIDSVKTADELKAAKEAVEKQISELPYTAKLTVADKAAVVATYKAYDAYMNMPGATNPANKQLLQEKYDKVLELEAKAIDEKAKAINDALAKVATGSDADVAARVALKADADAVKAEAEALNDEIEAVNTVYNDFLNTVTMHEVTTLSGHNFAKDMVDDVEIKLVKGAKEGATLEEMQTAMEAYNALTDYQKYQLDANALQLAKVIEKQLKDSKIKAVESFKIKTTTKRYTGSKMRVNWTVASGDESAIDGYRIYYSTKKSNSGYKYLAKTTKKYINHTSIKKNVKKGTRVYYRVRAYVEIDGQRYFSDYSTVGNRIWK